MNEQPEPDTLTRATLEEIQADMQRRLNGRVRELRLSLRDGGLVLEGFAPTYYGKQLAQHVVMESLDVPIRANEIEVL